MKRKIDLRAVSLLNKKALEKGLVYFIIVVT